MPGLKPPYVECLSFANFSVSALLYLQTDKWTDRLTDYKNSKIIIVTATIIK